MSSDDDTAPPLVDSWIVTQLRLELASAHAEIERLRAELQEFHDRTPEDIGMVFLGTTTGRPLWSYPDEQ